MIDLHTHSTASDGTFTPSQLIKYAVSKNIKVLALTDHDTTAGIAEAKAEAANHNIIFVPGIELSIEWNTSGEFHLLGLGLKETSPELQDLIHFLEQKKNERNRLMIQKLNDFKIDISYDEICSFFNTQNIGRPHIAQFLAEKHYVKSRQAAFSKYLASGKPCYLKRTGADLTAAVKAIKSSGGIPVMAHPLSIYVSIGKIADTIKTIRDMGVMGLEAWHPGTRMSEAQRLEKIAKEFGMIVTAGSDFHGEKVRNDRFIGHSAGGYEIKDKYWEEGLGKIL